MDLFLHILKLSIYMVLTGIVISSDRPINEFVKRAADHRVNESNSEKSLNILTLLVGCLGIVGISLFALLVISNLYFVLSFL